MSTMSKDRVTVKSTKNQIRFECQKFILKDKAKTGPFMLGKFRVDAQLTFQKLTSVDPKLEKKCHEEALKVLGKASASVEEGLEQLLKVTATQQKKEKQGDKKARNAADAELKKLNKTISGCQNNLGADLRKSIEALLKKEGVDTKVTSIARNMLTPVRFDKDAFSEAAQDDGLDDKSAKAWGNLGKGELALSDKHAAILQEIKQRTSLAKALAPFVAGREGDVNAARKELVAYSSHGQTLTKLLIRSSDSIGAMARQLQKDKKSIDPKVGKRLFKELDGLHSAAGSVLDLIEEGIALADELADILRSPEGAAEVAQYKSNYAAFVKGVATIKTQTKKSGVSVKVIDTLSKTLTKKK